MRTGAFSGLAAASVLSLAMAHVAQAQVVYSGVLDLTIPNTTAGLYVNVIDGSTFSGPGTFPVLGGPGANYDMNIFGSAAWTLFSPTTSGQSAPTVPLTSRGYVASASTGPAAVLTAGQMIDSASTFNTGSPSASALSTGAPVIFGFRFRNERDLTTPADDTVHFGWARVQLIAGQPGLLVDYAYEATPLLGIPAGAVESDLIFANGFD